MKLKKRKRRTENRKGMVYITRHHSQREDGSPKTIPSLATRKRKRRRRTVLAKASRKANR